MTALVLAVSFSAGTVSAAGNDDAAMELYNKAMDEHYLSVEFDKAEKALEDALKKCSSDCSDDVVAKLHVGLGTVRGVGLGDLDAAKESFVEAFKADGGAKLIEGLSTEDLEAAFEEAREEVGVTDDGDDDDDDDDGDKPVVGGDFDHQAFAEQAVHTPVPVYAEIPADLGAEKVIVRYKPFGGVKWNTVELKRMGTGFGGEIPCDEVTTTGDLKYYIIGTDGEGTPVATAGSAQTPFRVQIRNSLSGPSPALPGQNPPRQCVAKEDCPPGLPGCGGKGWGSSCIDSAECDSGYSCVDGTCTEGDGDEDGGDGKGAKNIISLGLSLDLALISGAEDVCSFDNSESYACFDQDTGDQFYGNPADFEGSNGISGGLGVGGARVNLGYDRILLDDLGLALGLRLGFAFGGSPSSETGAPSEASNPPPQAKSFLPLHAEGRVSYFFSSPLKKMDVAPHIFLGGGLAQVNASVPVNICDQDGPAGDANGCPAGTTFRKVDAYQITGLNFIGFGGGAHMLFTDNIGAAAELKFMIMLPTSGFVIAPTIGPIVAF